MRRLLAIGLIAITACGPSADCRHAAARWNATIGPYSDAGLDPGVVLMPPDVDVVKHRNGVIRRYDLMIAYDECFTDEQVAVAEAQLAELQERE